MEVNTNKLEIKGGNGFVRKYIDGECESIGYVSECGCVQSA